MQLDERESMGIGLEIPVITSVYGKNHWELWKHIRTYDSWEFHVEMRDFLLPRRCTRSSLIFTFFRQK